MRLKTQKIWRKLEADIIKIFKKNIDLMSLAQVINFLRDVFHMTAVTLVSVINHHHLHINGFHLRWDTLYMWGCLNNCVYVCECTYIYIYIYIYIWCTTWTLTKLLKKKLDGNYTRMLRVILNKSWRQHPTRHQLYGHLPPSRNLSKLDEPDTQDTAGEAWTIS